MDQVVSTNHPWSTWHDRLHRQLLRDPKLLPNGKTLLLAVSGGQDSMAMVGLLLDLQPLHNWQLQIWHGNHGWHQHSATISSELQAWCCTRKIPFSVDVAEQNSVQSEAAARHWRYSQLTEHVLNHCKGQNDQPCEHVLTGHTCSDRAETLLLNLARGTDLKGLSSLPRQRRLAKGVAVVRPMLNFSRAETLQICKALKLPIWLDPTNQNLEFSRNRVRHEVIPVLEALHPGCSLRMAELCERLGNYQTTQDSLASVALTCLIQNNQLDRQQISQVPLPGRIALMAKWIHLNGVPRITSKQLHELSQAIAAHQPPGTRDLANGWKIIWERKSVQLVHYG